MCTLSRTKVDTLVSQSQLDDVRACALHNWCAIVAYVPVSMRPTTVFDMKCTDRKLCKFLNARNRTESVQTEHVVLVATSVVWTTIDCAHTQRATTMKWLCDNCMHWTDVKVDVLFVRWYFCVEIRFGYRRNSETFWRLPHIECLWR